MHSYAGIVLFLFLVEIIESARMPRLSVAIYKQVLDVTRHRTSYARRVNFEVSKGKRDHGKGSEGFQIHDAGI